MIKTFHILTRSERVTVTGVKGEMKKGWKLVSVVSKAMSEGDLGAHKTNRANLIHLAKIGQDTQRVCIHGLAAFTPSQFPLVL